MSDIELKVRTAKRVNVMTDERPNERLAAEGAVPFTELEPILTSADSQLDRMDLLGNKTPLEAQTIGKVAGRVDVEEPVTKLGEKLAEEIEAFPPEREAVGGPEGNIKMTFIVGEFNEAPRHLIQSEEDLK